MKLLERFSTNKCLMVAGVYDGLTARLAELGEFDALWASGFSISASKCIPDSNSLTIDRLTERVAEIIGQVSIPVIVDCDEGYGSIENTLTLTRNLVELGVQGICLEDNAYPKVNSFLAGAQRKLVSQEEFCKKICEVKKVASNIALIARTEAIIADLGLEEAINRGKAYAYSGADLILLHSKYTDISQFRNLVMHWDLPVPQLVIPTAAPTISFSDFANLGFRMVIYANQLLRASVFAIEEVLRTLRSTGNPAMLGDKIVSMDHIFRLTNLSAR